MVLELTWASAGSSCCDTTTGHGHAWKVSSLEVNLDVLTLDPTFLSSVSQHLHGGNALQMQFQNYHTSFYSLLAAATQLTHSRAASRLNAVLVTFAETDEAASAKKVQNDLYIPPTQALKARLAIGGKTLPGDRGHAGPVAVLPAPDAVHGRPTSQYLQEGVRGPTPSSQPSTSRAPPRSSIRGVSPTTRP